MRKLLLLLTAFAGFAFAQQPYWDPIQNKLVMAPRRVRSIGMFFDGGGVALANNQVKYFTWTGGACTIAQWAITVDTGTITFDVWKIATGTAIPTVANTIVASAAPALAANTAIKSTTMTGWTTSVADGDIFAFKITAISSATQSSIILQCAQ
jgi:hypothetical protein